MNFNFTEKPLGRGNPMYIPKCIFSIWYVKTKKTWQLYKFTTLVLKITLNQTTNQHWNAPHGNQHRDNDHTAACSND